MSENQRVRVTKKMLKDSLIRLLKHESIHKLSVKEICAQAQINRTTFYKYYGSPYDLLEEMERDVLMQIDSYLEAGNLPDDRAQLIQTIYFVRDNIELCRLLLSNSVDPAFPEKLISLPSIRNLIFQRLDGIYSKEILQYIHEFVIQGGFSIIRKWIEKDERESPEEIADLLHITILKVLV